MVTANSQTHFGDASGEGVASLGTQAWNIADGFTKIKILRLLIELDLYETVAIFGKKDLDEQMDPNDLPYRRVEGFERVLFILRQLIGNCNFSIHDKKFDKAIIDNLLDRIDNVEKVSQEIATPLFNDVTKENSLKINEQHFRKCFDVLRNIKDELNFPINRAGLIFRQSDELDLDEIMREIEEGGS